MKLVIGSLLSERFGEELEKNTKYKTAIAESLAYKQEMKGFLSLLRFLSSNGESRLLRISGEYVSK